MKLSNDLAGSILFDLVRGHEVIDTLVSFDFRMEPIVTWPVFDWRGEKLYLANHINAARTLLVGSALAKAWKIAPSYADIKIDLAATIAEIDLLLGFSDLKQTPPPQRL